MTDTEIVTKVIELREDLAKAEERARIYQELYEQEKSKKNTVTLPPQYIPPSVYGPVLND